MSTYVSKTLMQPPNRLCYSPDADITDIQ